MSKSINSLYDHDCQQKKKHPHTRLKYKSTKEYFQNRVQIISKSIMLSKSS